MNVPERVAALRALMAERGYDIYMVPTDDNHQSEYVGEYFKARAFITGFTGSAGTAVFTKDFAGLWTDGRYFIQAAQQLDGSGVELMKMGEPGVPTVEEFIASAMPEGGVLGFDGRVVAMGLGKDLEDRLAAKGATINYSEDLIDKVWADRPALSEKPAFALGEEYTGESTASKLARIREAMAAAGADTHVVAALDDICWTVNLRGDDVAFSPMLLSYAIITMDGMKYYVDERKLTDDMKAALAANNITICAYNDVYADVAALPAGSKVLVDADRLNYALFNNIPATCEVIIAENPEVNMKCIKNETEINNMIQAQIKEGTAFTKLMYWVKNNADKIEITEISAEEKLEEFRKEQPNYLWPSFAGIFGAGEHGAIVHYEATPETDAKVEMNSFLLVDTGAGFIEGSTDITRTFAIGEVSDEMKADYTSVLRGHLNLAAAVFPEGTCGYNLDYLARQPLFERGLNYNHGTGHGIGYLMSIHEAASGFRMALRAKEIRPLKVGMCLSNEPGVYIEGSHGVRIENDVIVRAGQKTAYGQFMYLESITYVPYDLDAVNPDMMTCEEKKRMNEYHAMVYDLIAPNLTAEEAEWLKNATRAI